MSYLTYFSLEIDQDTPDIPTVASKLAELNEGTKPGDRVHEHKTQMWQMIIEADEDDAWYEHTDNMAEISRMWPGVLFTLHGTGEETGDQWVHYYRDGLVQMEHRPDWEPPPFDPAKLRVHETGDIAL